jgi:hypothetical protein
VNKLALAAEEYRRALEQFNSWEIVHDERAFGRERITLEALYQKKGVERQRLRAATDALIAEALSVADANA